jgi:hypothetical protein
MTEEDRSSSWIRWIISGGCSNRRVDFCCGGWERPVPPRGRMRLQLGVTEAPSPSPWPEAVSLPLYGPMARLGRRPGCGLARAPVGPLAVAGPARGPSPPSDESLAPWPQAQGFHQPSGAAVCWATCL